MGTLAATSFISRCASCGKWRVCLDLLQEMRDMGISTTTVNHAMVIRAVSATDSQGGNFRSDFCLFYLIFHLLEPVLQPRTRF